MSAKKNRTTIAWILIIIIAAAVLTQVKPLSTPFAILPQGYREYQWSVVYHIETKWFPQADQLNVIAGIKNDIVQQTKQKLTEYTDDHGDPIVVCNGPHTTVIGTIEYTPPVDRLIGNLYIPTITAIFNLNVTSGFYGYFPNGLPEAQANSKGPLDPLFDFLFPVAYAFPPLVIIILAIIAAVVVFGLLQVFTSTTNLLTEKQKFDDFNEYMKGNHTMWEKVLFAVTYGFSTVIAWLSSMGPTWVILIVAVVIILVYAGTKKTKR